VESNLIPFRRQKFNHNRIFHFDFYRYIFIRYSNHSLYEIRISFVINDAKTKNNPVIITQEIGTGRKAVNSSFFICNPFIIRWNLPAAATLRAPNMLSGKIIVRCSEVRIYASKTYSRAYFKCPLADRLHIIYIYIYIIYEGDGIQKTLVCKKHRKPFAKFQKALFR